MLLFKTLYRSKNIIVKFSITVFPHTRVHLTLLLISKVPILLQKLMNELKVSFGSDEKVN
jgi:hypothetical protein